MEASAQDTTVLVIQKTQETIMKTKSTTLEARNTSVMAAIDKHITTSITLEGTTFAQADLSGNRAGPYSAALRFPHR